jgi:hypothetical protein
MMATPLIGIAEPIGMARFIYMGANASRNRSRGTRYLSNEDKKTGSGH